MCKKHFRKFSLCSPFVKEVVEYPTKIDQLLKACTMELDVNDSPQDALKSTGRFVITMTLEPNGNTLVRSCEIVGTRFRNRTSFGHNVALEEAFTKTMTKGIKKCLESLSAANQILSLREHSIELPGLILTGPHLLAKEASNGIVNVIIRFKEFLGSIHAAFKGNIGLGMLPSERCAELSAKILSDISMPLLNICSSAELHASEFSENLGNFGRAISQRSQEIRFQTELLKRFISQQADLSLVGRTEEVIQQNIHHPLIRIPDSQPQ